MRVNMFQKGTVVIRRWLALIIGGFAFMNFSLGAAAQAPLSVPPSATIAATPYRINAGDELEVLVRGDERLQRDVLVLPDGTFAFPLVGQVNAAGRLPTEIERVITAGLQPQYKGPVPQVTVSVKKPSGYQFSVIGKVHSPGTFTPGRYVNALEALAVGPSEFANTGSARVIRKAGDRLYVVPVTSRTRCAATPRASARPTSRALRAAILWLFPDERLFDNLRFGGASGADQVRHRRPQRHRQIQTQSPAHRPMSIWKRAPAMGPIPICVSATTLAPASAVSAHAVHTRVSARTTTVLSAFGQETFYTNHYSSGLSLDLNARHSARVSEKLQIFGDADFAYDKGGQLDDEFPSLLMFRSRLDRCNRLSF